MILVYLSPVRWDSIAQRPHFFVKSALQHGVDEVLWIEPTASRFPRISDIKTRLNKVEAKSFEKPTNLSILDAPFLPIEPLGKVYDFINARSMNYLVKKVRQFIEGKDAVVVAGKPSRLALFLIKRVKFRKTIFDVMDDYAYFSEGISSKNISKNFSKLMVNVDECFFSSNNLMKKYGINAKSGHVILNACDRGFSEACKALPIKKNRNHKVFGYVGSIANWFDWDKVIKLANDNPSDQIILVGPNYVTDLPSLPKNIKLQKAIPHAEIPSLMSSFDYGIIPFKINLLTDSVDPVKYYEYLACNLEVISTRFGEMNSRIINGVVADFENYRTFKPDRKETIPLWDERFSEVIKEFLDEK